MTGDTLITLGERAGLSVILKRFPDHGAALERLFRQNPSFQSLCEDYRDCQRALASWRQSTTREAPAMREAYAELLRELEAEVRQFLEDEKNAGFRPGERGLPGS